jgi:crotonobetainyl-CoA:carnitine CoA-transferase CaiB-like acyl-CoA transferase
VLDFTRILAGPFCTMTLGDLGADVIKVERPGLGDDTRHWGPPFLKGDAAYYLSVNRNKRSVALDFDVDADRDLAFRLAEQADVVIENFRPGLLDSLGLGYEDLKDCGLVYCSITAFGPGPKQSEPGYDIAMQALSGYMSITGSPSGEPAKIGVAVLDVITGMYAAIGVLAALELRRQTGASQRITIPLFDASVASLVNQAANFLVGGVVPQPMGTAHPNIVPYQAFPASDGYVVIAGGNDRLFERLCGALDLDHLAHDQRFATNRVRVENREALIEEISNRVITRSVEHWVSALVEARVPVTPVRDLESVLQSPEAADLLERLQDPHRGELTMVKNPIAGLPRRPSSPPPVLGEHTDTVRSWLWNA